MSSIGNKSEEGASTPVLLDEDQVQHQSLFPMKRGTTTEAAEEKSHQNGIFGEMATNSDNRDDEENGDAIVPRSPEHLSPHHIFNHQLPSIKVDGGSSSCSPR